MKAEICMKLCRTSWIKIVLAVTLLAASAGAWAIHPFVHSPLAWSVDCDHADDRGPTLPDDSPAASQHSTHCQLCRSGDKATELAVPAAEAPTLPVVERTRWVTASEPIPTEPFLPGLSPRAPPSLV